MDDQGMELQFDSIEEAPVLRKGPERVLQDIPGSSTPPEPEVEELFIDTTP